VDAVAIAIAPIRYTSPLGDVIGCRHGRSGLPIEYRQEFRAREYIAVLRPVVGSGVADYRAGTIDGTVGRAYGQFGFTVTVEVVHEELRIVGPGTDILAEIDAPQFGSVHFIGIQVYQAPVPGAHIAGQGRFPLHDDLILTIAVEVA